MPYLIANDFLKRIQAQQLQQLQVGGINDSILNSVVEEVEDEVRSHLVQKYMVDFELTDTELWSNVKTYYPNDRVYTNTGGVIEMYYGTLPHPLFDLYAQYKVNDTVYYNGRSWRALRASTSPVAYYGMNIENIPYPNYFPTIENNSYWLDLGAAPIAAGTPLTDGKWTKGDNRDKQLLGYMCDMSLYHLHARLSPNNIPLLRTERYMGKETDRSTLGGRLYFPEYSALGWLQGCSEGRLTPRLPVIQPNQGRRIRWGGMIKAQNNY